MLLAGRADDAGGRCQWVAECHLFFAPKVAGRGVCVSGRELYSLWMEEGWCNLRSSFADEVALDGNVVGGSRFWLLVKGAP